MSKVVIIGAGNVGSSAAYSMIQQRGIDELVLIDIAREKAEGEALDLAHCAAFTNNTRIRATDDYAACAGADVIVITAGASRKPGQTRLDLIDINAKIIKSITQSIIKHNPDPIIFMVSNPVDVLTYVCLKTSGLPRTRVLGTGTMIDMSRLSYAIANHFNLEPFKINTPVFGEHGDSQFPAWSLASGFPTTDMDLLDKIFEETKKGGAEVIKKKGATYYSIGMVIDTLTRAILTDANKALPVSFLQEDANGITDVCLSVPAFLGREGIVDIPLLTLISEEQQKLQKSATILQQFLKNPELPVDTL